MRITKEVQVQQTVTHDIICNLCGMSCRTDSNGDNTSCPDFDGLIEAEVHGGYHSKVIGDTSRHVFSLCETCFMELSKSFKIPSYQGSELWGCSLDYVESDESELE